MFYFAWVDPATAFDLNTHSVEDEQVVSFEIKHTEGEFAQLSISIKNPRTSLLGAGRKVWAWLSEDGTPLFYGRLIALPRSILENIVTLDFLARPSNFISQKEDLAETLRVLPYFDPVWLNVQRRTDPDVVLETRTQEWHIDRTTHVVSVSDVVSGEDGEITLQEADHLYDELGIEYGEAPLRRVTVDAKVSWDQIASSSLDIKKQILNAFSNAGSPSGRVSSYTGEGLQRTWPEQGRNMNGGWSVGFISLERVDGVKTAQRKKSVKVQNATNADPAEEPGVVSDHTLSEALIADFFVWDFRPEFNIDYEVSRKRVEEVSFTLEADVQSIIVDPGEDEEFLLNVSSQAVGEIDPTDDMSEPPIGDLRRRSYMMTDRGHQSLVNLILMARAKLIARARAVNITVGTEFDTGLAFSCRKNIRVIDPRLPNGEATGKIVSYTLSAGGDGTRIARATIGCTIGTGSTLPVLVEGGPVYVVEGYVDTGYQVMEGRTLAAVSADVSYEDYSDTEVDDDGIDFISLDTNGAVTGLTVINGETAQAAVLSGTFQDIPAAINALNATFTEVELELLDLRGGPFQTNFDINVSDLVIPKTMEL